MKFDINAVPPNAKILLIRLRSIGDVTLNTAVFPLIRNNFPTCKLHYLVAPPCDQVVWNNPHLDEIIVLNSSGKISDLWAVMRLAQRLRQTSYDLVIDMHGGPRSALIAALSRARFKVGLKGSRRARFYNVQVDPAFEGSATAVQFQIKMLELLGLRVEYQAPKIYVGEDELKAIKQKLRAVGVQPEQPFAVFHPGVDSLHNLWEPEKFAAVADALQTRYDLQVLFACAPGQTGQVEDILKRMETPGCSLGGRTSLREFAALVHDAEFLLCHNSGPMHIGAAVGVPVFALFGPSAPQRWIPQVDVHHVFYKNIECSPCTRATRKTECFQGNAECKRLITAQEVVRAIEEKINLKKQPFPLSSHSHSQ